MLKMRIRLTFRRKARNPDGLKSIRCPTAPAMTVSITPAIKEISHAGK